MNCSSSESLPFSFPEKKADLTGSFLSLAQGL